jgi:hypothetical protein
MLSMVFGAGEGVEQVVVRVVGESDQQVNFTLLFQDIQLLTRVSDPYSFFPDPDPAFEVGDQSGSRALMTKN